MKTVCMTGLLATILLLSCQTSTDSAFDAQSAITMEKTPCFGTCPVYTFSIKGDGQAELTGVNHFDKIGTYRKQFSAEETAELFDAFRDSDFFNFKDEYSSDAVTDLPTTYLTFTHDGKTKKVKDYYEPPQQLVELEERVARLAETGGWEKTGAKAQTVSNDYAGQRTPEQQVEYGGYLVEIAGCHDCHSPKVMTATGPAVDPTRILSGHPAEEKLAPIADPQILRDYALFNGGLTAAIGPWGTSFSANLTPDETGLGNWTYENFERALRKGKFKGLGNGRDLLPPMPWFNLQHLKPEDMQAIWAYLQSIPPVRNVVPAAIPPAGAES